MLGNDWDDEIAQSHSCSDGNAWNVFNGIGWNGKDLDPNYQIGGKGLERNSISFSRLWRDKPKIKRLV